jgi:hypothetical protein
MDVSFSDVTMGLTKNANLKLFLDNFSTALVLLMAHIVGNETLIHYKNDEE